MGVALGKTLNHGVKLTFFSVSHLAPKYVKVVANSKSWWPLWRKHTKALSTLRLISTANVIKIRTSYEEDTRMSPVSHMEVGCPGTWGLELLTPNPGSNSTPKAYPTRNPATSPTRHTQPKPKHPSHRARSSVEIIVTVITNNNNNNDNNNKVVIIKGRGEWEKTLKHSENWSRCPKH